ncbi:hypothetical protein KRP22_013465 [Phytophthora ramorum]|uniref:RxLR effector protein n=1 Tax=Phytophthora ramorum TaxID=164328 RepID=H3GF18_PHYRM|nr:hypothetical protein KRP23_1805 [Phytophthora ramorum]KAH7499068.1 hypothetical protein KRP22_11366 [Phytophthora ramorum]
MRSFSIILLLIAAIFLGLATAVSTHKNSNWASVSKITVGGGEKKLLRGLAADQGKNSEEEERALNLNFDFLKKLKIPGVGALKATLRARKAEKPKAANMFKIMGERDDQIFPKFDEWFKANFMEADDVIPLLVAAGKTDTEAGAIAIRYRDWKMTKINRAPH